jgi:hypothetical protein
MFSFNSFIPERPSTATLYDIENQYEDWYEEDNNNDFITLTVYKLFKRV